MRFNFKIQQYQTDAVDAVVKVFSGQGFHDKINYIRDVGEDKTNNQQMKMDTSNIELKTMDFDIGYKNEVVELTDEQILKNIQILQNQSNIKMSSSLIKNLGRCSLDI